MHFDPVVFDGVRDRDGIEYRLIVRGTIGRYYSTVECPECDATEAGATAATVIRAITGAKASLDSHHNMNHRVGIASRR
jgi:hypothetical protein